MKSEKLREVLRLGEGQAVEFKSGAANVAALGQTVCGFLNAMGGTVVCGVGDGGKLTGVPDAAVTAAKIERALAAELSPKALVWVGMQEVEGKALVLIEAPAGKDVPYTFRDAVFLREGSATRKAPIEVIREMVLRRSTEPERWERRLSACTVEADAEPEEVRMAVGEIVARSAFPFRDSGKANAALEDLALSQFGRLTQGGVAMFGREPGRPFPQLRVRAVAFPHDKASDAFRDMKTFDGPLVPVVNQLFGFIFRNTPTLVRFSKGRLQREDACIYPEAAIREGLINAFAHRDYTEHSGGVAVHVYPTRLEIWNSGGFPPGITPETMREHGHLSILRNPDIAHVLHLRGFMEKIGRGSFLIMEMCRKQGLPDPAWASDAERGVTLTFHTPEVTPEVRLTRVINGEMSRQEMQEALGLKDDEHFRTSYFAPALEKGLVEMTIPDKPRSSRQRYRLTAAGKSLQSESRKLS